jgi:hypothetical protein
VGGRQSEPGVSLQHGLRCPVDKRTFAVWAGAGASSFFLPPPQQLMVLPARGQRPPWLEKEKKKPPLNNQSATVTERACSLLDVSVNDEREREGRARVGRECAEGRIVCSHARAGLRQESMALLGRFTRAAGRAMARQFSASTQMRSFDFEMSDDQKVCSVAAWSGARGPTGALTHEILLSHPLLLCCRRWTS